MVDYDLIVQERSYYWRKKWERVVLSVRPFMDSRADRSFESDWHRGDTAAQLNHAESG